MRKIGVVFLSLLFLCARAQAASRVLQADYPSLAARADINYAQPVARGEEGLPAGNGRMGSLVWTTPHTVHLQVNRVDVFGNDSSTTSFPERHSDYCGGCGFVDIDFPEFGSAIFPTNRTLQHLDCSDGLVSVEGDRVKLEVLAGMGNDVMAVRVTDDRRRPGTISINLRALRPPQVRTVDQLASSEFSNSASNQVFLTQGFSEGSYYCGSAVGIAVAGRAVELRKSNDSEWRLVVRPGRGAFTVLISSAASFKRDEDLRAAASALLNSAGRTDFDRMISENRNWWADFWSKSFIHLHSADGIADTLQQNYEYYLFVMASSSRGSYPTKFNGMLWITGGDLRKWGGEYWGANQSCLYNNALFAANHDELMEPMFHMYCAMLDSCAEAARQQWGSQGVFIPETVAFDGLAHLPDDIAAEMRDLYLCRKPWNTASQHFLDYAAVRQPHSSRWNWIQSGSWVQGRWVARERGAGPFGPVTHTFSRGAKIAYQYWVHYEYTGDEQWLRDVAYPVIKGEAELYRNFPNLKKGDDGKYHIYHVNSNESIWDAQDTDEEISSMMGIFPAAIRASEILKTDDQLRSSWREVLANLAPLPVNSSNAVPIWRRGIAPAARGFVSGRPDGNTMPAFFFDLCTLESDPAMRQVGGATFDAYFPSGFAQRRVSVLSKLPLVAAVLGRTDAVKELIPSQVLHPEVGIMANRMDLREGQQTTSIQRLGNAADALHTALCYDLPPGPAQASVIRVFAAWPKEWDAEFTLLCRGGFLVTSAMKSGDIQFVELESKAGGECRLRNPWGDGAVELWRDGQTHTNFSGGLLSIATSRGEHMVITRANATPEVYKRVIR